jgi:hypothetical protein
VRKVLQKEKGPRRSPVKFSSPKNKTNRRELDGPKAW